MLFGEYFRGGHDTGLITIIDGNEHRHQGHQCLTGTDVTLQQTVHLAPRASVFPNLSDDAFLCFRQRER